MTIYTVAEIRKNMRIALDMAETTPIFIKRHDKIFMLRLTPYDKPPVVEMQTTAPHPNPFYDEVGFVSEKDLEKIKIGKEVTVQSTPSGKKNKSVGFANNDKLKEFAEEKGIKFCANGHAIPAGRSKCMGKGCKYA